MRTECGPFLVAVVLAAVVAGGCSGGSVIESKLIGSWAIDAPLPKTLVYTFQTNHTYTMALSGESGSAVGTWELYGEHLVMAMGAISKARRDNDRIGERRVIAAGPSCKVGATRGELPHLRWRKET